MNKLIEKKESKSLDFCVVLKNLEYLKDHLVILEKKINRKKIKIDDDLEKTILICNSDQED
ncbi:unnamed protein product (macronuclear) [Paramecium tetraurelia]|uniref:Uncharacterized protein n=1 Tax=Paramecium tetraurelia TaxID=5888 RepID=A0D901_PARTE|nr:uncharacterized protein GSPATT00014464001 [Paramecium tetraurelia]CAK79518.1 unnamed protein product [Paramecium tetraurelia]|eukprot:XP_001446915.1 hypothetical protein (macronuclear) [Paramecium tetraurelia strain d4-2]